jgi:hypothetical protein
MYQWCQDDIMSFVFIVTVLAKHASYSFVHLIMVAKFRDFQAKLKFALSKIGSELYDNILLSIECSILWPTSWRIFTVPLFPLQTPLVSCWHTKWGTALFQLLEVFGIALGHQKTVKTGNKSWLYVALSATAHWKQWEM